MAFIVARDGGAARPRQERLPAAAALCISPSNAGGPMTKLSIGQAWTETIESVKRDGRLIVPVALAFAVIPATLFALAVPRVPAGQMREPGVWMLLYALLILAALARQIAIMRMAIGPAASVGEAIRHALRRAPAVIGAALMFAVPAGAILFPFALPI